MFSISPGAIAISIALALVGAPLAQLFGAVSELKSNAAATAVSIEMRRL